MNGGSKRGLFGLSPSRRDVVKGTAALAGAAALGGIVPKASAADEDTLTMLTWPGHADAHVVAPFEEEHGVKGRSERNTPAARRCCRCCSSRRRAPMM